MRYGMRASHGCVVALLLLLFWQPLPAVVSIAKPEDVGLSSERLRRITELIDRQVASKYVSGAVALVARRGRVVYLESRGMSDIESKRVMKTDTLFRIASMSKPVTAVALLVLMEEGKVRLRDPVSRFIPQFQNLKVAVAVESPNSGLSPPPFHTVSASREITVSDLLTHTSGLVSGGVGASEAAKNPRQPQEALADYVPRLAAFPLAFQPGTRWTYSPLAGFETLGRIVEVASGQPFDRFLKDRLFVPLGMKDTSFGVTSLLTGRLATVYERTPGGLTPYAGQNNLLSATYFSGAGGLISTAEDYLRFAQMLLDRGQVDGRRILSPTSIDLMTGTHVADSLPGSPRGRSFGLGVQVINDPFPQGYRVSTGSFGWAGAYCTFFWVDPKEKLVSIYLAQSQPFSQDPSRDFENAVMQAVIE